MKKSPWSSVIITDISRATDINHSKILDPENPDRRRDYSLALIYNLNYKVDSKNMFGATEVITHDVIKNPTPTDSATPSLKNLRLSWTRNTDSTIGSSSPISLPFSIVLPTTPEARSFGSLGSIRFWPIISWSLASEFTMSIGSQWVLSFSHPVDREYDIDDIMEQSTLLLSNTLTGSVYLTNWASFSQSIGVTSKSSKLDQPLEMDQTGSMYSIGSSLSFYPNTQISVDVGVTQSVPWQGDGLGAKKAYDDNLFRFYHVAQTNYSVSTTILF